MYIKAWINKHRGHSKMGSDCPSILVFLFFALILVMGVRH